MTQSETREKLFAFANWHEEYARALAKDGWVADSDRHKEWAIYIRQVAETIKEGWVSVPQELPEFKYEEAMKFINMRGTAWSLPDLYKILIARPKEK